MILLKNYRKKKWLSNIDLALKGISYPHELKAVLAVVLNKVMEILRAERGSIFLVDSKGEELVLSIAKGNGILENGESIKMKIGDGILGFVAKERRPLLVRDINKDNRFNNGNGHNYSNYKTNSFLSCPIMLDNKLVGVINITDKESKRPFSQGELECLLVLSQRIAWVIEKIQSNQRIQELKAEVKSLKMQLETAKKFASIGKIAGSIAHEINNPLDGIMRYTNLSLDSLAEDSVVKEYLLEAKGGLERIANIIRSLLEFSRRSTLDKPVYINVNEILESTILSLSRWTFYRNINIIKVLADDLPSIPDWGIGNVFTNLFKNALDAMPSGGNLTINTQLEGGVIKIKISDTGCGIEKENIDKIFEPFFSTKEIGRGSGLGLAICREIIQRYNGKIYVESEIGQGSTFMVELPVKRV